MIETGCMTVAEDYFFTNNIEVLSQDTNGEFTFYTTDEGEFAYKGSILYKKCSDGYFIIIKNQKND